MVVDGREEDTNSTESTDEEQYTISKDDAFYILKNARRRALLRYLIANEDRDRFQIGVLSEELAAWEANTTVAGITSTQRKRVYIALVQNHLPTLDKKRVVEYEKDRGVVRPLPLLTAFSPYVGPDLHCPRDHLTVCSNNRLLSPGGVAKMVRSVLIPREL